MKKKRIVRKSLLRLRTDHKQVIVRLKLTITELENTLKFKQSYIDQCHEGLRKVYDIHKIWVNQGTKNEEKLIRQLGETVKGNAQYKNVLEIINQVYTAEGK